MADIVKPQKDKTWVHMGHTMEEIHHPKTPAGHKAYLVTEPNGKKDTWFAQSVERLGDSIAYKIKKENFNKSIKDFFSKAKNSDESSLDELKSLLEKARRRMSDEVASDDDEGSETSEDQGFREFDPDQEESDADRWLQENDPEQNDKEEEDKNEELNDEDESYDEYGPDEDEESHQREVESTEGEDEEPEMQPDVQAGASQVGGVTEGDPVEESPQAQGQEEVKPQGRFPQPSKEDIAEMRQYTRPWEHRARDTARLKAEAHKNPVLHHEGRLVEARNAAHKDRQDAYTAFQSSPEYQDADPISQMEMDAKFHTDWQEKNPEHLSNAVKLHGEAHKKGQEAKDIHAAAKDEQIRHVLTGGAQAETPMSTEEALQHAGGAKGEEGTQGSVTQDRASSFAAGNQDFLKQYAKDYDKKGKKPKDINDMMQYDEGSRSDVQRVLGDHPALKDPAKKAQVDKFFEKYHPLIGMNAHKVLNKLGLDSKRGDIDLGLLHEAGMHGLMQSINDYDHDHPSKASFSTHAGNKMRGLMQTALRDQDQIPQELRAGAKKFSQAQAAPVAQPKKDINAIASKHPPEVADRIKRIQTSRQVLLPKIPKPEGGAE